MGQGRRLLTFVKLLMAALLSGLIIANRLTTEAKGAMAASDQAFDQGELKRAMVEARYASYAAIPWSPYRKLSIERLEAIAVGSEATGRSKTALLAWSSLLASINGASSVPWIHAGIEQQPEQHMGYSLAKVSGASESGTTHGETELRASTRPSTSLAALAMASIWVAVLLGILGSTIRFGTSTRDHHIPQMAVVRSFGLYIAAACCWCIGWVIG